MLGAASWPATVRSLWPAWAGLARVAGTAGTHRAAVEVGGEVPQEADEIVDVVLAAAHARSSWALAVRMFRLAGKSLVVAAPYRHAMRHFHLMGRRKVPSQGRVAGRRRVIRAGQVRAASERIAGAYARQTPRRAAPAC